MVNIVGTCIDCHDLDKVRCGCDDSNAPNLLPSDDEVDTAIERNFANYGVDDAVDAFIEDAEGVDDEINDFIEANFDAGLPGMGKLTQRHLLMTLTHKIAID